MEPKYREVTHDKHIEQLAKFNENIDTLLIGDSIIERVEWFAKKQFNENVLILAKGGDTIEHLYYRLTFEGNPNFLNIKKVLFNIGTNNLSKKNINTNDIVNNINTIYVRIKEMCPNAEIRFIPLYYLNKTNPEVITEINSKLKLKMNCIDKFWNDILPNHYVPSYYLDDVHLNSSSYDKFYENIKKFI